MLGEIMLKLLQGKLPRIDVQTQLPPELSEFQQSLDSAFQRILALKPDFDGEQSSSYEKAPVERAIIFLKKLALSVWQLNQTVIPYPLIFPGPEGSIDIQWKTKKFQLLINFPKDIEEPASYYGDDYGKNTTEGLFDGTKLDQIFLFWLLD